ncbi:MAG: NAD+ synthase [Coriobacteriia bacterium]|nr:NAD+ synthase [Coriobacteriia bacterium]
MRIALAQIDTVVGDITGNTGRVLEALAEGERARADLIVVPELALTGYPPEDLLAKAHFIEDNLDALEHVAASCTSVAALVGFVDRSDGVLHNAAAFCREGKVAHVYRKRLLPNYGVFDEERYFEPGQTALLADLGGLAVAPTICEDIWMPGVAAEAAGAGAALVVNISASPFHIGKGADREAMLRARAADNGVWLAYCNLVGGQDELVFDGRSVVISPAGEVVARAASFAEDLVVADIPPAAEAPAPHLAAMPGGPEEIYGALCLGLGDYVRKNGFSDVVIGLSGGIDSALVAAVAVDALGPDCVRGVTMPSRYSSAGSVEDSRALASNLGIDFIELPIEPPFSAMLDTLEPLFEGLTTDVTEENLQARVRGTLLMALSNKFGWLVLATGNKSELSVGYSTLYGDMVGGFAPLKDVFKTRVCELARWCNRNGEVIPRSTLEKPPSAELRPDQTDQDTLPPYDVLDAILAAYVEGDLSREQIVEQGHDVSTVEHVCRMVDASEYKRRQGPLGIRVTPKAFGKDRRMPVTNRYRG